MLRIIAPALAALLSGMVVPADAAEQRPRKFDKTCKLSSNETARLAAEQRMLALGRMKHSDMNVYFRTMSNGKGEAPALNVFRTTKRIKPCPTSR